MACNTNITNIVIASPADHLRVHPLFNPPDLDDTVQLCSTQGTCYYLPSFTLRNTSSFFRNLLLPTKHTPSSSSIQNYIARTPERIPIHEKDSVIERVLCIMSGLETPRWESFDELESTLSLIEAWDAPGPLSVVRSGVTAPLFLEGDPLRLYALATRYGWGEEAKLASTHTLRLSLYDERHQGQLQRLSARNLMALLGLHRRRRDEFKQFIDSEQMLGGMRRPRCSACGLERDDYLWRELKARMFLEMDERPLGDTLLTLEMEEWPEVLACWNAKCAEEECGRACYDKLGVLRKIRDCIGRLPSTV